MDLHNDNFDEATGIFCSMVPDPADEQRWDDIADIEHRLQHAGGAHDLARNLDLALLALEKHALGKTAQQLEPMELSRLQAALSMATTKAYAAPPTGLGRRQTVAGLLMIAHTLEFWSLPDALRASKGELRRHLQQLLRIFRNGLHNACLLDEIVEDLEALVPWHDLCGDVPPNLEQVQHLLSHPVAAVQGFIGAYSATAERPGR